MWITKSEFLSKRILPILTFHVTFTLSLHWPSIFFPFPFALFIHCHLNVSHSIFFSQGLFELPSSSSQLFLKPNGGRCLLFCRLESYVFNIQLISIGNTLFMLVCFDIYIFIELEEVVLIFSQLACLPSSLTRNFSSRFQLCFDFAMHYFGMPLLSL